MTDETRFPILKLRMADDAQPEHDVPNARDVTVELDGVDISEYTCAVALSPLLADKLEAITATLTVIVWPDVELPAVVKAALKDEDESND